MALTNRKGKSNSSNQLVPQSVTSAVQNTSQSFQVAVACIAFCLFLVAWQISSPEEASTQHLLGTGIPIDTGVSVVVDFEKIPDEEATVSMGPHRVTLELAKSCENPSLWMRLEGDALVGIVLHENGKIWDGSFSFPMEGKYNLEAYWYGCDGKQDVKKMRLANVTAKGTPSFHNSSNSSLFPSSAWISSKQFTQSTEITQPYIWHLPTMAPRSADLYKTSSTFVSQQSTTKEAGFYKFDRMSNYEIVCWIGSGSAKSLFDTFLQLRSLICIGQRPFKFHYHEADNFVKPAYNWTTSEAERFRKCKQIFVSMDEVREPTSQEVYVEQVTTFLNHLLKAFPDDTFPIWMSTVMESPAAPSNCLDPAQPRSSEHPCNTALKKLFSNSPFPSRVQLFDNTAITYPMFGENRVDVATAIALRIFVLTGRQVKIWRDHGQEGTIKGLVRGDVTEPNFELVPYDGWL